MTKVHNFVKHGLTFEPYIRFSKFKKLNSLKFNQDHESQSASLKYCSQSASCRRHHGTLEISSLYRPVAQHQLIPTVLVRAPPLTCAYFKNKTSGLQLYSQLVNFCQLNISKSFSVNQFKSISFSL